MGSTASSGDETGSGTDKELARLLDSEDYKKHIHPTARLMICGPPHSIAENFLRMVQSVQRKSDEVIAERQAQSLREDSQMAWSMCIRKEVLSTLISMVFKQNDDATLWHSDEMVRLVSEVHSQVFESESQRDMRPPLTSFDQVRKDVVYLLSQFPVNMQLRQEIARDALFPWQFWLQFEELRTGDTSEMKMETSEESRSIGQFFNIEDEKTTEEDCQVKEWDTVYIRPYYTEQLRRFGLLHQTKKHLLSVDGDLSRKSRFVESMRRLMDALPETIRESRAFLMGWSTSSDERYGDCDVPNSLIHTAKLTEDGTVRLFQGNQCSFEYEWKVYDQSLDQFGWDSFLKVMREEEEKKEDELAEEKVEEPLIVSAQDPSQTEEIDLTVRVSPEDWESLDPITEKILRRYFNMFVAEEYGDRYPQKNILDEGSSMYNVLPNEVVINLDNTETYGLGEQRFNVRCGLGIDPLPRGYQRMLENCAAMVYVLPVDWIGKHITLNSVPGKIKCEQSQIQDPSESKENGEIDCSWLVSEFVESTIYEQREKNSEHLRCDAFIVGLSEFIRMMLADSQIRFGKPKWLLYYNSNGYLQDDLISNGFEFWQYFFRAGFLSGRSTESVKDQWRSRVFDVEVGRDQWSQRIETKSKHSDVFEPIKERMKLVRQLLMDDGEVPAYEPEEKEDSLQGWTELEKSQREWICQLNYYDPWVRQRQAVGLIAVLKYWFRLEFTVDEEYIEEEDSGLTELDHELFETYYFASDTFWNGLFGPWMSATKRVLPSDRIGVADPPALEPSWFDKDVELVQNEEWDALKEQFSERVRGFFKSTLLTNCLEFTSLPRYKLNTAFIDLCDERTREESLKTLLDGIHAGVRFTDSFV